MTEKLKRFIIGGFDKRSIFDLNNWDATGPVYAGTFNTEYHSVLLSSLNASYPDFELPDNAYFPEEPQLPAILGASKESEVIIGYMETHNLSGATLPSKCDDEEDEALINLQGFCYGLFCMYGGNKSSRITSTFGKLPIDHDKFEPYKKVCELTSSNEWALRVRSNLYIDVGKYVKIYDFEIKLIDDKLQPVRFFKSEEAFLASADNFKE